MVTSIQNAIVCSSKLCVSNVGICAAHARQFLKDRSQLRILIGYCFCMDAVNTSVSQVVYDYTTTCVHDRVFCRRMLHGRTAFTETEGAVRHLQGCYVTIESYINRLRVLQNRVSGL